MTALKREQNDIESQKLLDNDSLDCHEFSARNPINSPLSLSPPPSMQYFSFNLNIDNQLPIYPIQGVLPYLLYFPGHFFFFWEGF